MPPEAPTVPLPLTIRRALSQIASELADMPRECARDHQELCLWKGRLARRLRGVLSMRVPVEQCATMPAGVVLGNDTPRLTRNPRPISRTIRASNGRTVRVETRQLEMVL